MLSVHVFLDINLPHPRANICVCANITVIFIAGVLKLDLIIIRHINSCKQMLPSDLGFLDKVTNCVVAGESFACVIAFRNTKGRVLTDYGEGLKVQLDIKSIEVIALISYLFVYVFVSKCVRVEPCALLRLEIQRDVC